MGRLDAFWKFPAVAYHPVKYASFRQPALPSGCPPIAESYAEHTDLFALGDDLGFGLRTRLLLVLAVILLAHVQVNRYDRLQESAISIVTIILNGSNGERNVNDLKQDDSPPGIENG